MTRTRLFVMMTAALLSVSACDTFRNNDDDKAPKTGSLTHNLTLVGDDGKLYGTVELDPIGGGRMYDTQGRLVGSVVPAVPQQ